MQACPSPSPIRLFYPFFYNIFKVIQTWLKSPYLGAFLGLFIQK